VQILRFLKTEFFFGAEFFGAEFFSGQDGGVGDPIPSSFQILPIFLSNKVRQYLACRQWEAVRQDVKTTFGQTLCDSQTSLHLFYLISSGINPDKCIFILEYSVILWMLLPFLLCKHV
jgi:hypothetical protein